MKKLFIIVTVLLMFTTHVFADEEIPPQPDISGLSVEEANQEIDAYNGRVEEYNVAVTEAYEKKTAEVEAHNQEEDQKVKENQQQIEAYEASLEKIEAHEEKGITENRVDSGEDIPEEFEVDEDIEPQTITVTEAEEKSGETVKVTNIHIFIAEGHEYDEFDTPADAEQLAENEEFKGVIALAEWETVEVDLNDTVQVSSEAKAMGYKSTAFYKWFEGYTNGYWIPSFNVFSSTAYHVEDTWSQGVSTIVSYDEGAEYGVVEDVFSLYAYAFVRTAPEPEEVEEYIPDYLEAPERPVLLEKMEHVKEQEKEPEVIITPPSSPSDPEPPKPEEPTKVEPVIELPVEIIVDPIMPLASNGSWALVNLLLVIVSVIESLYMTLSFVFNKEQEEDGDEERKASKMFTIIPSVVSIVVFILTENMRLPMVYIDKYTILMLLITLSTFFVAATTKNRDEEVKEEAEVYA